LGKEITRANELGQRPVLRLGASLNFVGAFRKEAGGCKTC